MLRRIIVGVILLGAAGLGVGYLIFGRNAQGDYMSLKSLLTPSKNVFDELVRGVQNIPQKQRGILIAGAVGGGLGLIVGALSRRSRRRDRSR
jgi:hypothetical protein